jgi:hypothetical protein
MTGQDMSSPMTRSKSKSTARNSGIVMCEDEDEALVANSVLTLQCFASQLGVAD